MNLRLILNAFTDIHIQFIHTLNIVKCFSCIYIDTLYTPSTKSRITWYKWRYGKPITTHIELKWNDCQNNAPHSIMAWFCYHYSIFYSICISNVQMANRKCRKHKWLRCQAYTHTNTVKERERERATGSIGRKKERVSGACKRIIDSHGDKEPCIFIYLFPHIKYPIV